MFTPRVLIADGDSSICASLTRQFRATGWDVMSTSHVQEGVDLCERYHPDLVLVDVQVSGGEDAFRELRARTPAVLVAVMVADEPQGLRDRCLAAGAMAFLTKPLRGASVEALKKVVRSRQVPPRVLISDDDPAIVRSLERAARHEGLDPVSELDASHIVGLAKEVCPDVIVLDINQKNLDGRDVLAQLKADPQTRDIRVVMLTGVEDQLTRHDCLILGADDYVVKPLDPLFFVRIARKLGERQHPRPMAAA
jgi:two-component system, OmpR family, response regulator AdeR